MTFQKFLSFLIFPLSLAVCAVVFVITTAMWVPLLLYHTVSVIVWKNYWLSFNIQGAINWLDDRIYCGYYIAYLVTAICVDAFDGKLYK